MRSTEMDLEAHVASFVVEYSSESHLPESVCDKQVEQVVAELLANRHKT